jgi:two-component sensor histidine kinase
VKNNLAVIASLLSLQASRSSNEGVASALRASQHRVESMALIHEQLYATDDLGQVDLAKHASMLAANLLLTYGVDPGRIVFQVTLPPLELGPDQAIPVGLILGELVSNALKHAFPDGRTGAISIGGARSNGRITLTVTDDGIGIPEGDDFERRKSLGMQIVQILTRQLKGTFEVAGGQQATFKISFPEAESEQQIAQSAGSGR